MSLYTCQVCGKQTCHPLRATCELGQCRFKLQPEEGYPDNNPKTFIGMTKPGFDAIPPAALLEFGKAMGNGKVKYNAMNWRNFTVSSSVYYNALLRHAFSWWDGEDIDQESGAHHLGHVMGCCSILLDAASVGRLNDDRPPAGRFAEEVRSRTIERKEN